MLELIPAPTPILREPERIREVPASGGQRDIALARAVAELQAQLDQLAAQGPAQAPPDHTADFPVNLCAVAAHYQREAETLGIGCGVTVRKLLALCRSYRIHVREAISREESGGGTSHLISADDWRLLSHHIGLTPPTTPTT